MTSLCVNSSVCKHIAVIDSKFNVLNNYMFSMMSISNE